MSNSLLVTAIAATFALTAPAEGASKTRKKRLAPAPAHTTYSTQSQSVYFAGVLVGKDPDPFIRFMIHKDPRPGHGE